MGSRRKRSGVHAAGITSRSAARYVHKRERRRTTERTRHIRLNGRSRDRMSRIFLGAPILRQSRPATRESLRGHSPTPTSPTTGASTPSSRVNLGLRSRYEAPFTEGLAAGRISTSRLASLPRRPSSAPRLKPGSSEGVQPRLGMALRPVAGSSLVDSRRMGHLSQHRRLSIDRVDARAAASVLESVQHREHARAAIDAGKRIRRAGQGVVEHVCRRSRFPRELRAQLAGVGTARSAGVADGHRHLPRNQGQPSDAGVRAEHVSSWRRQSLRVVPERLRLPRVERKLGEKRLRSCKCGGGCGRD